MNLRFIQLTEEDKDLFKLLVSALSLSINEKEGLLLFHLLIIIKILQLK